MKVSVITAAGPGSERWLSGVAEGLADQEVDLEWLVVADRATLSPPVLGGRTRLLHTTDRARGPAAARTVGLIHAEGDLLYVHDSDDALPPGSLDALVAGLSGGWAIGRRWTVIDARGDPIEHRSTTFRGAILPGRVRAYWDHHGHSPFPPAQVLYRTDEVWKAGGWPPIPADEDTALLLAVSDRCPGDVVEGCHLLSRRHPSQVSATTDAATWRLARRYLRRRPRSTRG